MASAMGESPREMRTDAASKRSSLHNKSTPRRSFPISSPMSMQRSLLALLAVAIACLQLTCTVVAAGSRGSSCSATRHAPPSNKWLKFKDGRFRIMQIADVHYQNGNSTTCQDILPSQLPCSDLNSTAWMRDALAIEHPNLVVFTGDNVWYNGNTDLVGHQKELTKPVDDAKTPYMMVYGNHDCEAADCRTTLINGGKANSKYDLTEAGPKELHGKGNYAYTVTGSDGKPAFALYMFDSGAYYGEMQGSYDFIRADQVDWYNKTSIALEAKAGKVVPAIAFFHIPLPEYDTAFVCNTKTVNQTDGTVKDFGTDASKSGMGKKLAGGCNHGTVTGVFQEGVYSANANGGLFSAFVTRGDVKMVNVGHDHVNDYCATLYGIRLCYGGGFGYHAYGQAGWPRRTRILDLFENGTIFTYKLLDAWGGHAKIDPEYI